MVIVADVIGPVWWSIAPDAADGADGILEIRVHPDDPTASAALPTKGNGDAQGPRNALRAKEAIEAWGRGERMRTSANLTARFGNSGCGHYANRIPTTPATLPTTKGVSACLKAFFSSRLNGVNPGTENSDYSGMPALRSPSLRRARWCWYFGLASARGTGESVRNVDILVRGRI
jgi:hypothetical protein